MPKKIFLFESYALFVFDVDYKSALTTNQISFFIAKSIVVVDARHFKILFYSNRQNG